MTDTTLPQPDATKPDSIRPGANQSGGRGTTSVKTAALWAMSGRYSQFVLQFITSVIISRFFLAPEEVGLFSVALATAMLLAVLQDFGLTRYIAGHPQMDAATIRGCSVVAVSFSFALAGIIAAIAWPVAHFYGEARLGPILLVIAASYLFVPWSVVPNALLVRDMDFRSDFAINLAYAGTNAALAMGLAWAGWSAESLAWAMLGASAVRAVVAQLLRPTPLPWPLRAEGLRGILSFGSASSLIYISGSVGVRSQDMVIGRLLGMAATGLYSRGAGLATQFHLLVMGAIGGIYYPAFARLRDEGKALGPYYQRVVAIHGAMVWPAMALLAVLAKPVVLLLYGPAWGGAAPLLACVALAEICFIALPLHIDLPILLGRMRALLARNLIDTALSIGTLVAAAHFGLLEAAASRIAYGLLWFLLYAAWLQRIIGFAWRAMGAIYLRSALLAVLTIAPALWATHVWRSEDTLGFTGLAVAGTLSGMVWLLGIIALRHPARADLVGMALHILGPLRRRLAAG